MGVLEKLTSTPVEKIPEKLLRWLWVLGRTSLNELQARSGWFHTSPSELKNLVAGRYLTPVDAAKAVLEKMEEKVGVDEDLVSAARNRFQSELKDLLVDADLSVKKQFRILGEKVDFTEFIDWHLDPRHNHRFDAGELHSRIKQCDPAGGFDIKYPWELSRLQHLPRLSLAFLLTRDRKYVKALVEQVDDWITRNPVGFGPNWACTMDVGIRAANLALAVALVAREIHDGDFAVKLVCSLIQHGRFISGHLEWSDEVTSNHYLADIAGLAVLGFLLEKEISEASDWFRFAREELATEIEKQVYPDGWDFEASTAYHRLVMECFLVPAIMMERGGEPMSDKYRERLRLMTGFVRDITLPDGSFPLIGDNDSGLFVSLQPRHTGNLNYLLALASAYLGNPPLKLEGVELAPEILWLVGDVGRGRFEAFEFHDRPISSEYPDGGLWSLRSKDGSDLLTFRLGSLGQNGNGGHAHNDQLSVTIWFDKKPVIVDPGSACYTSDPEKRNLYRSTKSHATISIGDEEQNRFVEGNLFTLPQETEYEPAELIEQDESAKITGTLRGYGPWSSDDVRFTRTINYLRPRRGFEITDKLILSGEATGQIVQWNFPLAPGLRVKESSPGQSSIEDENGVIVAHLLYLPGWRLKMDATMYSPAYGEEVPNITMRFTPPFVTSHAQFIFRAAEI